MAQIQPFGRQRVRGSATQMPTEQAGKAGQALAGLGRTVSQVGQKVAGSVQALQEKRREAEISDFADNTSFNFRRDFLDQKRQLDESMAGTNYEGYTQNLQAVAQKMEEQVIGQEMDSDKVRAFKEKTRSFIERAILTADGEEHQKRAQFYTQERIQRAETLAGDFFTNPDPFLANEEVSTFVNELEAQEGVLFNRSTIDALKTDLKGKVRQNIIAGQIREGLPGLVDASMTTEQISENIDSFLDGQIPGTESIFDDMSSDERRKFDTQIRRAADNIHRTQVGQISEKVKSSITVLNKLDSVNPEVQREIQQARFNLESLPDSEDKAQMMRALDNAETVHEFRTFAHHTPNSELMREDLGELLIQNMGLDTAAMDLQAKEQIQKAARDIVNKRDRDGAGYVKETSPTMYADKDLLIEHQKRIGIANPTVFSKDDAQIRAGAFLEEKRPRVRKQMLDEMREEVGDAHYFRALNELSESNSDFHKGYAFSAFLENEGTQERIIEALSDPDLSKTYRATVDGSKRTEANRALTKEIGPHLSVFSGSGLGREAVHFAEMAESLMQQKLIRNPGANPSDVAKQVAKEVITDNFNVIDRDNSKLVIPKSVMSDGRPVEIFVGKSLQGDTLSHFGLSKEKYDPENRLSEQRFWKNVAENSYWANNSSGDGMVLMATDLDKGVETILNRENGSPIEVRFDQIDDLNWAIDTQTHHQKRAAEREKALERLKDRGLLSLHRGR